MFSGFRQTFAPTRGVMVDGNSRTACVINTLIGGNGTSVAADPWHPETHVCWHKVAGKLAERFTVARTIFAATGTFSKPDGGEQHVNYAKRAMAADQVQVMQSLGFDRLQAVGHDRGGRVLQFMMLDHPEALERGVVLDIAPTDLMYAQTEKSFATKYFWWFFQIEDAPSPGTLYRSAPGLLRGEPSCDPEQDTWRRDAGSSRCLYPDLQRACRDPCGVRGLPRRSRDRHSYSHGGSNGWPEDDPTLARDLGRERHGRAGFRCGRALEQERERYRDIHFHADT